MRKRQHARKNIIMSRKKVRFVLTFFLIYVNSMIFFEDYNLSPRLRNVLKFTIFLPVKELHHTQLSRLHLV